MRTEEKRCHHPEVARARAAERPKQLTVVAGVAIDDAAVGEHDLGSEELIRSQAVLAAEDSESSAQCEARNPNRRARACRKSQASLIQGCVNVAEPCAGTNGGDAVLHGDRMDRCDVDHDSVGRRSSRAGVPAAARRCRQSRTDSQPQRLGDVVWAPAQDDGLRAHTVETCFERLPHRVVVGRPGQHNGARDPLLQPVPIRIHCHAGSMLAGHLGRAKYPRGKVGFPSHGHGADAGNGHGLGRSPEPYCSSADAGDRHEEEHRPDRATRRTREPAE